MGLKKYYSSIILIFLLLSGIGPARADISYEWEFKTPLDYFIGKNSALPDSGVAIYTKDHTVLVSHIEGTKFYYNAIAGKDAEGYFLLFEDELIRRFEEKQPFITAFSQYRLVPLSYNELQQQFNIGWRWRAFWMALYLPVLMGLIYLLLPKRYRLKTRVGLSAFLVADGLVIAFSVLWLMLGTGATFLTYELGGIQLRLNSVLNISLMVTSISLIWLMLYLNDETTHGRHRSLTLFTRATSIIASAFFLLWLATTAFSPQLPKAYWNWRIGEMAN